MLPVPDVLVVGAGAGGLAAAWRLCTSGLRVTVIDAGWRYDPARDYPQTGTEFERQVFPYSPTVDEHGQPRFAYGPAQSVGGEWASYRSHSQLPAPITDKRSYVGYSHVRGIGGSTLHFQGEAHRYHPDSLRTRTLFGAGVDWPLRYAELERYYDCVEQLIGVAAPTHNPFRPRTSVPAQAAHRLSYASQRLEAAFRASGMRLQPNALAILSAPLNGRPPCNYCNACSSGCPTGDKGSADVVFLPAAMATGRLSVQPGLSAIEIELDARGQASGVVCANVKGERTRLTARAIALAAGAIETPRLLLVSRGRGYTAGASNRSRAVGRNLTETLFFTASALHPDPVGSHRGVPIDGTAWDRAVPHCGDAYVGGFRVSTAHGAVGFRGPLAYARSVPGFGASFQQRVAGMVGRGVGLVALGDWLPNDHTYVDLAPDQTDAQGVPVAKITSFLGENERHLIRAMTQTVRDILAAAGVREILSERSALDQFHATHVLGTCRIGADRETSVCDPFGISHDVRNLAVVDGSAIPSSGSGDSPFLTISAMAVRCADRLCARLAGTA